MSEDGLLSMVAENLRNSQAEENVSFLSTISFVVLLLLETPLLLLTARKCARSRLYIDGVVAIFVLVSGVMAQGVLVFGFDYLGALRDWVRTEHIFLQAGLFLILVNFCQFELETPDSICRGLSVCLSALLHSVDPLGVWSSTLPAAIALLCTVAFLGMKGRKPQYVQKHLPYVVVFGVLAGVFYWLSLDERWSPTSPLFSALTRVGLAAAAHQAVAATTPSALILRRQRLQRRDAGLGAGGDGGRERDLEGGGGVPLGAVGGTKKADDPRVSQQLRSAVEMHEKLMGMNLGGPPPQFPPAPSNGGPPGAPGGPPAMNPFGVPPQQYSSAPFSHSPPGGDSQYPAGGGEQVQVMASGSRPIGGGATHHQRHGHGGPPPAWHASFSPNSQQQQQGASPGSGGGGGGSGVPGGGAGGVIQGAMSMYTKKGKSHVV
uniref:Uncharacterized protein n=1 Tax=Chromera velia CCMP2878 TaxID=1169474 RepID=A0A0G4FI82_9ALVE|eukprot:Cvel_17125.t1-p1 / transcript=Cvel_17125.t1 / gene=Cvel_17125 / organism=Chromera_velia_CCMP2878 / gene_product=hypothetical protein / transcript_product=hypothetical protein / location=Cvel_scaffold1351:20079-22555(+) / protein_length=432 / sequence_SO=supercontig / SO=protein_coding / is_pseudo=false